MSSSQMSVSMWGGVCFSLKKITKDMSRLTRQTNENQRHTYNTYTETATWPIYGDGGGEYDGEPVGAPVTKFSMSTPNSICTDVSICVLHVGHSGKPCSVYAMTWRMHPWQNK